MAHFAIIGSMKYLNKLSAKITISVVIGLLLAYAGVGITHVTRPCTLAEVPKGESISRCESIEKAFIHPHDLLTNKQNSLTHFSEAFVITSLLSFALLSFFNLAQKKPKKVSQAKA